MLLAHRFGDPALNSTVEDLLSRLNALFSEHLLSVIVHGSVVFDDFVPGYSDLDFVAIVDHDLSDGACHALVDARKTLRIEARGLLSGALEGAFLPRRMLDPTVKGRGFWWGTTRERPMEVNHLGWFVHEVIRQAGVVAYGQDLRNEFPAPTRDALLAEMRDFLVNARRYYESPRAWMDGLFTVARMLVWLQEGRLSSKTGAADWAVEGAKGAWKADMGWLRDLRLHPEVLAEAFSRNGLNRLRLAFLSACDELEDALARF